MVTLFSLILTPAAATAIGCFFCAGRSRVERARVGSSLPRQLNGLRKEGTVAGVPDPTELGRGGWGGGGIVQELYESRGGRPGLSVLTSLLVSVEVKQY